MAVNYHIQKQFDIWQHRLPEYLTFCSRLRRGSGIWVPLKNGFLMGEYFSVGDTGQWRIDDGHNLRNTRRKLIHL